MGKSRILLDSHEVTKTIAFARKYLKTDDIEVIVLEACDLILILEDGTPILCIERKRVDDFLDSMKDRLKEQPLNMQPYPYRFIIIEGDFDELRKKHKRYRQYSDEQIYGMIAALEMDFNVSVLGPIKTPRKFWIQVERLIFRAKNPKAREYAKIYKPKITAKNKKDKVLSAICSVHGLSEKKGMVVKDEVTSISHLCTLSVDDLCKIDGIGPVMAKRIKETFK